jgi:DNA primase
VVHGGRNPTSLTYQVENKFFHCWGECGFKGDVYNLVMAVEHCSFKDSIKRVEEYSCTNKSTACAVPRPTVDPWRKALEDNYAPKEVNEVISSPLVEKALANPHNPYVESGRFRKSTMDYFEVGYCEDNEYFMNRAIITIHDDEGRLIGFSGRDMSGTSNNKYRIKKGFKKGLCLYNMNRAKRYVSSKNPLILCEGFGQVWRLHEACKPTAVALMGKELTQGQYNLVSKYTTKEVILALDFDSAGMEAMYNIGTTLSRTFDVSVAVSNLEPDVDLGDMTAAQALCCIGNALPFKQWVSLVYV